MGQARIQSHGHLILHSALFHNYNITPEAKENIVASKYYKHSSNINTKNNLKALHFLSQRTWMRMIKNTIVVVFIQLPTYIWLCNPMDSSIPYTHSKAWTLPRVSLSSTLVSIKCLFICYTVWYHSMYIYFIYDISYCDIYYTVV